VVRLAADTDVCLDPLRTFAGDAARRYAIGYLSLLVGAAPTGLEGAAVGEAVDDALAAGGGMDAVGAALAARAAQGDAAAATVGRKLAVFARDGYARLAFGGGARLRLDADCVVFHAPGLPLPTAEELASEHLAARLLPEQVAAVALLYLVAAVGRSVAFADPRRFAALLVDEAYALTGSPQGRALLLELVRDGRKHNAALWLLSQHPRDLASDATLADLLGPRMVFRVTGGAAADALALLGLEPREEWVERLGRLGDGQCLYRDVRGRVGCLQVRPAVGELHAAFDTTPVPASRTAPP
jgi:hypothetical protein